MGADGAAQVLDVERLSPFVASGGDPAAPLPDERGYAVGKRIFDVAFSLLALLVLAPFCAVIALLVRMTSSGPALYRQTRVGRGGELFECLKFRTMVHGAHAARDGMLILNEMAPPVFKIRDDPRVTPIGYWLRKYSFDEIPQFVNVLRGEMSVVGPRPPLPEEVAKYQRSDRRRLAVAQGITGLWQVTGRGRVQFDEWVRLDLEYIKRRGFWYDLWIVARTIPAVLSGRGAS